MAARVLQRGSQNKNRTPHGRQQRCTSSQKESMARNPTYKRGEGSFPIKNCKKTPKDVQFPPSTPCGLPLTHSQVQVRTDEFGANALPAQFLESADDLGVSYALDQLAHVRGDLIVQNNRLQRTVAGTHVLPSRTLNHRRDSNISMSRAFTQVTHPIEKCGVFQKSPHAFAISNLTLKQRTFLVW